MYFSELFSFCDSLLLPSPKSFRSQALLSSLLQSRIVQAEFTQDDRPL